MKALDLIVSPSPHIHSGARITGTSYNFLIALLPAVIMGISTYGFDALRVICASIACAMVFEALTQNRPFSISASSLSFGIPLAASTMTICLFMGLDVAISFALVISVCTAVIFQNHFEIFIYFLLNCIMGAYWMQNCRERRVFIKAGFKLGFLNMVLATAIGIYIGDYSKNFKKKKAKRLNF